GRGTGTAITRQRRRRRPAPTGTGAAALEHHDNREARPAWAHVLRGTTHMATLIVDSTGATPGSFTSIQAAINAAGPEDTVQILAGTYTEALTLSKHVHL